MLSKLTPHHALNALPAGCRGRLGQFSVCVGAVAPFVSGGPEHPFVTCSPRILPVYSPSTQSRELTLR